MRAAQAHHAMEEAQQLDLFTHSRDVILRNEAIEALLRRDPRTSGAAALALARQAPADPVPALVEVLIGALDEGQGETFTCHDAARDARLHLMQAIRPAALRCLGEHRGDDWLRPLWAGLAGRASRLSFHAGHESDHAAPYLLCAGDWAGAAAAVEAIESWRRIPVPLGWMTEARLRLDGIDSTWPLLAELAWLAPLRFDVLSERLAEPLLTRLRKRFDADFEGDGNAADLAWLPAWLLIAEPGLMHPLAQAQVSRDGAPERAMQLLLGLLRLERQGRQHDLVQRRKALRDLHPALYALYIGTR